MGSTWREGIGEEVDERGLGKERKSEDREQKGSERDRKEMR